MRVFPESTDFILPSKNLKKVLVNAGWNIEKTIFFTMPYRAISPVNSGIIEDYKHKVYYRVFVATKGLIEKLFSSELRLIVNHEKYELLWAEKNIRKGTLKEETCMEAEFRHKPLLDILYKKYGKNFTEITLKKYTNK